MNAPQIRFALAALAVVGLGCQETPPPAPPPPSLPVPAPQVGHNFGIDPARLVAFDPMPKRISPEDNPSFDGKVELGQRLFFERKLSGSGAVSCESCHVLANYGIDGLPIEKSPAGKLPRRNTPTVFNAATNGTFGWDGRARTLEEFLRLHLVEETGMGAAEKELPAKLAKVPGMPAAFEKGFEKGKGAVTFEHASMALAAYVRTLLTPSRWEHFLTENKTSITTEEKSGFNTFMDVGCGTCHGGVNFGGQLVQKLGLAKPWPPPKPGADQGRYEFTKDDSDRLWFRSAPLRNLTKTGPYFHDGSVATMEEAVKLMATYQLGKELKPEQVASIVTFLAALAGDLPADRIQPPAAPAK